MYIADLLSIKTPTNSTTPRIDIELLLAFVLNQPRSFLYSHPEYKLSTEQEKTFIRLYNRRLSGEPIAYILGKKEFWSLELTINKNVLIPRPETEILIELTLNNIENEAALIADLGTGSGAIAFAMASERPSWNILATDISKNALKLARHNAAKFQLKNIEFYCGSWCDILPNKKLDAIVSNPPYIAQNDPHLQWGDIRFEPKIALEAGDGMQALQQIITQAQIRLKNGGFLILEHGYNQSEALQELLNQNNYQRIKSYKDFAGIDRAVTAQKIGE